MRTVAVLPVKSFARAKRRLGGPVDLAEAMAADVLDALERVVGLDEVVVVSGEPSLRTGFRVVPDADEGHSAAALRGIAAASADRVLLVPGDCPAMDPAEIDALLRDELRIERESGDGPRGAGAAPSPGVVVVPDRHGSGTNALLLSPPDAIVPSFGPGSMARHAARARAARLPVRIRVVPSLALDVDTPGDLDALLTAAPAGAAPRTRAVAGRLAA